MSLYWTLYVKYTVIIVLHVCVWLYECIIITSIIEHLYW